MARNGLAGLIARNCLRRLQKWSGMLPKWPEMVWEASKWPEMVKEASRWLEMVWEASRWPEFATERKQRPEGFGLFITRRAVGFSQRPDGLSAGRRTPSPVGELMAPELPRLPASVRSPCSTHSF